MVQQSQSETTPKLTQKHVSWSQVTVQSTHTNCAHAMPGLVLVKTCTSAVDGSVYPFPSL